MGVATMTNKNTLFVMFVGCATWFQVHWSQFFAKFDRSVALTTGSDAYRSPDLAIFVSTTTTTTQPIILTLVHAHGVILPARCMQWLALEYACSAKNNNYNNTCMIVPHRSSVQVLIILYSGISLFRTPLGEHKVSWLKEVSSFQGLFYTLLYVTGTVHGVLIKGDVSISGVSLQKE